MGLKSMWLQVAVSALGALVGRGLPATISMFNRICRSIFTRGESNLNRGWSFRAKVLVEGEGLSGLAGARGRAWEHPSGARRTSCVTERSLKRYEVKGGLACSSGRGGGRSCSPG